MAPFAEPLDTWAQLGRELLNILSEKQRFLSAGMAVGTADRLMTVRWVSFRKAVRRLVAA